MILGKLGDGDEEIVRIGLSDLPFHGGPMRFIVTIFPLLAIVFLFPSQGRAQELAAEEVLRAIEDGRQFLVSRQGADGSWTVRPYGTAGPTGLAVLALINSGMTAEDPPVARGLD